MELGTKAKIHTCADGRSEILDPFSTHVVGNGLEMEGGGCQDDGQESSAGQ